MALADIPRRRLLLRSVDLATSGYRPDPDRGTRPWQVLAMVLLSAFFWSTAIPLQWHHDRLAFWIDVVVGTCCYVVVFFRHRWPLPIALGINLISCFSGLSGGPAYLAAASLATRRIGWELALTAAAVFTSAAMWFVVQPVSDYGQPLWSLILSNLAYTMIPLVAGVVVGSNRELTWILEKRAAEAEAQRDERERRARRSERTAIAREMHDVLAHRISQVSMHSGVLAFRSDLSQDQREHSAALILAAANSARDDLDRILDVLSLTDEESGRTQGYAALHRLVVEARAAGQEVRVQLPEAELPRALEHTVFRIVQEGLTNAAKHAPGAPVTITITGGPGDTMLLQISNPLGVGTVTPGAGLGLVGIAERVRLLNGSFEHGGRSGRFVLSARLPWPATATAEGE